MEFAWTRFFHLYGPHEAKERLVPSVISALLSGEKFTCNAGERMRDYLHVEDAASAVWAVAESTLSGSVNIASGEPVKLRVIAETLGRILHASERLVVLDGPAESDEPLLLAADVRRIKQQTGWAPAWSLESGLRQVATQSQESSQVYGAFV